MTIEQNIHTSYLPGDKKSKQLINEIIRVNHSGEYGAIQIYLGQIKSTEQRNIFQQNNHLLNLIKNMYQEEIPHYEYFAKVMKENNIRPSILLPLWSILGYLSGYFTGLAGQKVAMTCTTGVEEIIGQHYYDQIERFKNIIHHSQIQDKHLYQNLHDNITKFMHDELNHLDCGIENGAQKLFGHFYLNMLIKSLTKVAIFLAKRF